MSRDGTEITIAVPGYLGTSSAKKKKELACNFAFTDILALTPAPLSSPSCYCSSESL